MTPERCQVTVDAMFDELNRQQDKSKATSRLDPNDSSTWTRENWPSRFGKFLTGGPTLCREAFRNRVSDEVRSELSIGDLLLSRASEVCLFVYWAQQRISMPISSQFQRHVVFLHYFGYVSPSMNCQMTKRCCHGLGRRLYLIERAEWNSHIALLADGLFVARFTQRFATSMATITSSAALTTGASPGERPRMISPPPNQQRAIVLQLQMQTSMAPVPVASPRWKNGPIGVGTCLCTGM